MRLEPALAPFAVAPEPQVSRFTGLASLSTGSLTVPIPDRLCATRSQRLARLVVPLERRPTCCANPMYAIMITSESHPQTVGLDFGYRLSTKAS